MLCDFLPLKCRPGNDTTAAALHVERDALCPRGISSFPETPLRDTATGAILHRVSADPRFTQRCVAAARSVGIVDPCCLCQFLNPLSACSSRNQRRCDGRGHVSVSSRGLFDLIAPTEQICCVEKVPPPLMAAQRDGSSAGRKYRCVCRRCAFVVTNSYFHVSRRGQLTCQSTRWNVDQSGFKATGNDL